MICSFIFGAMSIPYPSSGGLGDLDEALAGGVSFGVEHLAAVGLALDVGTLEGLVTLAVGQEWGTDVEESLGVLAGGWTGRSGVMWGVRGWAHEASGCVILKELVRRWGVALVGLVLGHGSAVRDGKLVDIRWPMQLRRGLWDWD